jgi:SAM-dependent methyltransferase
MLDHAKLTSRDLIYDLGSGDGRFLISAAKRYGCRGHGADTDQGLVDAARAHAQEAGVSHLVQFSRKDVLDLDYAKSWATVVIVSLPHDVCQALGPKIVRLRDGVRVLSYSHELPGLGNQSRWSVEYDGTTHFFYYSPFRGDRSALPDWLHHGAAVDVQLTEAAPVVFC